MPVYIESVNNYDLRKIRAFMERAIAETNITFNGVRTVVIKPNIVQARTPETGVVTHPLVVEALVDALMDRGITDITIAEGPALGVDARKAFLMSGYLDLAKRKQLKLANLLDAPHVEVHTGYGYDKVPNTYDESKLDDYKCGFLRVPKLMVESDMYIDVAKLKTHNRTAVSLSMKNQWALLEFKDRQMYHRIGLHEPIAQLARAVQPHLTILDGILGLEGNGPILGSPVESNVLVMGRGLVETDIVGSKLIGKNPKEVIHIARAVELGLGDWNVDVKGASLDELCGEFDPAPLDVKRTKGLYVWRNHRACHLDDDSFHLAVKMAKKNPKYWKFLFKFGYYVLFKRLDIVRGKGNKMPEFKKNQRIIVSGECARELIENYEEMPKNVVFLPGCPPDPEEVIKAIIKM